MYFLPWEPTWLREPTYDGSVECRKAEDGLYYTEAEFVIYYGPECGPWQWSRAQSDSLTIMIMCEDLVVRPANRVARGDDTGGTD